jgi:hypothetical protein
MSNRPIQHQLETKSRIAFESTLPAQWIYRTVNPDYGIDGFVEVFSEKGIATGDFFFVQLKATGKEDLPRALTIRLPQEKCDYYDTLALPLLLVLFHQPSGQLFAKWFSLPPVKERYRNEKSVSFIMNTDDEWLRSRCSTIATDLMQLREKLRLTKREERMARYCEAKANIDLSAPASPEDFEPTLDFVNGEAVIHDAFGRGIIEEATDYYFFVKFDDDEMLRKFDPGDSRGFVKITKSA